jgi:hypothetical protein
MNCQGFSVEIEFVIGKCLLKSLKVASVNTEVHSGAKRF